YEEDCREKRWSLPSNRYINAVDGILLNGSVKKVTGGRQKTIPIQRYNQEYVVYQPIDIAYGVAQKRGGKYLSTEYVNASTQMLWRCAKDLELFIE
ncbi:14396_t:CDS:2, partial [Acaulospora morrowiae]